MFALFKSIPELLKDRRGLTAVEYALIAGVVVVTVAVAFSSLESKLSPFLTALTL